MAKTNTTNLLGKAVIDAANKEAGKYGEGIPAKNGHPRLGSAARNNVIRAAVEALDDNQKASLAKSGTAEKHGFMAAVLIEAKTTVGVTLPEQMALLKAHGSLDQDTKMPSWPTASFLTKLLGGNKTEKPAKEKAAKPEKPAATTATPVKAPPKRSPPKVAKKKG